MTCHTSTGTNNMSLENFAQKMAAKAYFSELAASRALGYTGVDAYTRAFRVMDETYARAYEIERPYVWQVPRTVRGRR